MLKSKKLIALIGSTAVVLGSSLAASATTGSFSFSLDPNENSGVGYSSYQTKNDNEDIAYITPTSGNLVVSDLFYFSVANTSHRSIAGYIRFPGSNDSRVKYNTTIHCAYNSGENVAHRSACLFGDTDRYNVSVNGRWTP